MSKWTQFMDMHSGGGQKLDWAYIYIEAPEDEAAIIFQNRFGRNPHRVTCTCCGEDYSLTESEDLIQATGYERGCDYDNKINKYVERPQRESYARPHISLEQYLKQDDVLFIYAQDIKPEEREGELHSEGYTWVD